MWGSTKGGASRPPSASITVAPDAGALSPDAGRISLMVRRRRPRPPAPPPW
jgi:hypothetical protein